MTHRLLREVPRARGAQVPAVLLAALLRAVERWTGEPSLLVGLVDHGRHELVRGADVSRTVGLLSTGYPVRLRCGRGATPAAALAAVQAELEAVPNRGMLYGLLAYLSGHSPRARALRAVLPRVEVFFNYYGQGGALSPAELLAPADEPTGGICSPRERRYYLLYVEACVVDGRLRLACEYSQAVHRRETVERLLDRLVGASAALAAAR